MNILVVNPIENIKYSKVYPIIIRAIDIFNPDKGEPVFFNTDSITAGTTREVIGAINTIESSLIGLGYDVRTKTRSVDFDLHGRSAPRKWALKWVQSNDIDKVLIIGSNKITYAKEIVELCEKEGKQCLEVEV